MEEANRAVKANHIPGAKLVPPEGMTKSQYKKQLKRERWEIEKVEIKRKRKELQRAKKAEMKAKITELKEKGEKYNHLLKRRYPEVARNEDGGQNNTKFGMIIDCSYDDYMLEKEVVSLSGQITRSYSSNRTNISFAQLLISNVDKRLEKRFEERIPDHKLWKSEWIKFSNDLLENAIGNWEWDLKENSNEDIRNLKNVTYLTADSDEILTELEPNHVYVIGGIVDKGRHKELCKSTADKLGIKTARLPIDEFINISGRRVLTTAHVVELLLKWFDLKDWKKAFEVVLPPRKIKEEAKEDNDEDNTEQGKEDVTQKEASKEDGQEISS